MQEDAEYERARGTAIQAYHDATKADTLWTAELVKVFGAAACDARYDPRGGSTPELARLSANKYAADTHLHKTWDDLRQARIWP
jgi:hypothetical protein